MDVTTPTSQPLRDETSQVSPPRSALRHTWGLGVLAIVLCSLLGLSGLVLMFFYQPEPSMAALSLLDLEATSSFAFFRGVHFWGSRALLMVVWLHLFRGVARETYRPPRHRTWLLGLGLLLLTLALAHSGTLLPSEHATRTEAGTLRTLYVLHCVALPVVFLAAIACHLGQVRNKRQETS